MRLLMVLLAVSAVVTACGSQESTEPPSGLAWSPPSLSPPVSKIAVRTTGGRYDGAGRDCRVRLPARPVTARTDIVRCRNLVLIGGEVRIPGKVETGSTAGVGLWLRDFTGVAHLEGVRLRGTGLSDGLWISSAAPGAAAQVENVRVDEVHAAEPVTKCLGVPDPHPDLIQLFKGPETLRIDHFTGYTTYQGLYPDSGAERPTTITKRIDLRNGNIELIDGRCAIADLFDPKTLAAGSPTSMRNFWAQPNGRGAAAFYPYRAVKPDDPDGLVDSRWWGGFRLGDPPGGDFVPPGGAGLGYRSPGYLP